MSTKPRTHLLPTGSMPQWTARQREIMLHTPMRFIGRNTSSGFRSNMGQMCDTFKVFGVNANPFKTGTTGGEGVIVSRKIRL